MLQITIYPVSSVFFFPCSVELHVETSLTTPQFLVYFLSFGGKTRRRYGVSVCIYVSMPHLNF
jgi:hypothetical protein